MDEAGKKSLWERYTKEKTPEIREQIIIEYAPLVKIVAGRLSMYLGHAVEFDDLVGYGIFGLIDAIDKMVKAYKGDPASVLLDILYPEQNSMFIDNYVE